MKPNEETRQFELDPTDREALGAATPEEWPFDEAVGLLNRAQKQHQAISEWDLSEFPAGERRTHLQQQQWKLGGHLTTIVGQLADYLPSPADGAEQFLSDQPEA